MKERRTQFAVVEPTDTPGIMSVESVGATTDDWISDNGDNIARIPVGFLAGDQILKTNVDWAVDYCDLPRGHNDDGGAE